MDKAAYTFKDRFTANSLLCIFLLIDISSIRCSAMETAPTIQQPLFNVVVLEHQIESKRKTNHLISDVTAAEIISNVNPGNNVLEVRLSFFNTTGKIVRINDTTIKILAKDGSNNLLFSLSPEEAVELTLANKILEQKVAEIIQEEQQTIRQAEEAQKYAPQYYSVQGRTDQHGNSQYSIAPQIIYEPPNSSGGSYNNGLGGVLAGYGAALRKSTIEEKLKLDTLKQYYIRDLYSRLLKPVDLPNETNYSGSIFFNAPSQLPVTVIIEYKNASYGFAFDSPTPTSPSSLLTPTSPPLTLSLPPPTLSVSPSISPPSAPAEE